jgi:hypothetical protein
MDRTLLYYPTILIRNDQWIRQSILYWDSIGSIVPQGMERLLERSYDIEILQREGLYKIYRPDDYVQTNKKLAEEFETTLENELAMDILPRGGLPGRQYHHDSWVYEAKIYPDLVSSLIDKSIAIRKGKKVYMPSSASILYMSLLAKHMANDDLEAIATPSTDDYVNLRFAFPNLREDTRIGVMDFSLQNVLPVPIANTKIVDILKFKERRKDELLQFRQTIYQYQDKLKQVKNPIEIRDLNSRFAEKIQIEVSNLGKAFKGDDIHFFFGSLKNLLAVETPAMLVAYAIQFPDPVKVNISIAGAVISGAISLGEYLLDSRNKENERLAQNSFSYLFLAKEEGII